MVATLKIDWVFAGFTGDFPLQEVNHACTFLWSKILTKFCLGKYEPNLSWLEIIILGPNSQKDIWHFSTEYIQF